MAAFRNAAIDLIRALGTATTCRRFAAAPLAAFRALGTCADFE